jgi:phage shock protein A
MTNTQSGQDEQNVGNLEYSYSRQLALLEQVRSGLADIGQSRVRVEEQMAMLAQSGEKLKGHAAKARQLGREDLAKEAMTRREQAHQQLADLEAQYTRLRTEEAKLAQVAQALEAKVQALQTQTEAIRRQSRATPADRLRTLKQLRDEGLLTQAEYEAKRAEIINSI